MVISFPITPNNIYVHLLKSFNPIMVWIVGWALYGWEPSHSLGFFISQTNHTTCPDHIF